MSLSISNQVHMLCSFFFYIIQILQFLVDGNISTVNEMLLVATADSPRSIVAFAPVITWSDSCNQLIIQISH